MPAEIEILFRKFIAGDYSRSDFDKLMDHLQDNQHEAKVRAMLKQVYDATETTPVRSLQAPQWGRRWAMAAAVLVALATGIWWFNTGSRPGSAPAFAGKKAFTQRAEQKYILLPDSTQVWVNAASTLEFPETFAKDKREVFLSGEAYFDVKHADRIPFIIHTANDVTTRVLGTAFNIKAYPGQLDIIVAVKRGKVQVTKKNQVMAVLTAGQRVQVMVAPSLPVIKMIKEEEVAEWTSGKLIYDSLPVSLILQDIERTYNVHIELLNNKMKKEVFTTSFRRDIGPKEALEIICMPLEAKLTIKDGVYIIE